MPDDAAYFHAQFRRVNPLPYKEVYTILDGVEGSGPLRRHLHGLGRQQLRLVGRGRDQVLPGRRRASIPTICGTGTEDYFCGAYNFDVGIGSPRSAASGLRSFNSPYAGLPQVIRPDGLYKSQQRFGLYRWHIMDPVRFEQDLRVTIQALGWRTSGPPLPAPAGRHRLGRLLVPDPADRSLPGAAATDYLEVI